MNYVNEQVSKVKEYTQLVLLPGNTDAPKDSLADGASPKSISATPDKKISIFGPIAGDSGYGGNSVVQYNRCKPD